jgi:flagellar biosynthesis protein FliQ
MYSTVISISLGGMLAALAENVAGGLKIKGDGLYLGWFLLLVVMHLSMFWSTAEITTVDGWGFAGFVFIVTGPVVLLFASHLVISVVAEVQVGERTLRFVPAGRRFLVTLATLQVWVMAVTLVLGGSWTGSMTLTAVVLLACLAAAVAGRPSAHRVAVSVCWLSIVGGAFLREGGVIG